MQAELLKPEWKYKMAFSNDTNSSSVMPNLLHMFVDQKKTLRFNNFSNPALEMQEEIMASFYILIIVGFFGFLLFVMMLSNIVSSKPENYIDYLYSGKLNSQRSKVELPGKDSKDTSIIINSTALLELQRQGSKNNPVSEALRTDAALKNV
ncbi:small integral membrane protein 34 [Phalacrocorax aristotelis]|uniref:small integral membrane protein 34 n=1 Tax=Phalacrocorax aristotelis TaxID=126867 RepID=UPI003F4BE7F2